MLIEGLTLAKGSIALASCGAYLTNMYDEHDYDDGRNKEYYRENTISSLLHRRKELNFMCTLLLSSDIAMS